MNSYSLITDIDQKIDIIDHVNQDHPEEVLAIAKSQHSEEEILSAKILDIFQEGVLLHIQFNIKTPPKETFFPFQIEGSLEDKIFYLAYAATVKQGRNLTSTGKHFFEVINKQYITTNIIRLTVKSTTPLPEYYPGYAYAFLLKTIKKHSNESTTKVRKKYRVKNLLDRFFIWLMKHLSSKNRKKLLKGANKNVRPYTLRKTWKSSDQATFSDQGHIDIYTHNDTLGSQWAKGLSNGDLIMSRSESADKHSHLIEGQALLIADETAYPAIAGIIEEWQNPLPPQIIIISSEVCEQDYFKNITLPAGSQIHKIICLPKHQTNEVLSVIMRIENIDVVWAALEGESAKRIRHHLRNERKILGKNNHTRAYWKIKSNRKSA
ncbi:siderophore-interacting protein [Marinomonas colpomeniae]|uniref:SIP domain-containing protein n=1 Tax=Marinomonas colpomeniae TaxID=2774408 RepID=A0ABR8NXN1_9GAMM|nr:siderophore-interacting protein [Marinomonas colpomeniae]MBD5770794.1 SIP domain-containing protein [Marinomonas colpomeniae]